MNLRTITCLQHTDAWPNSGLHTAGPQRRAASTAAHRLAGPLLMASLTKRMDKPHKLYKQPLSGVPGCQQRSAGPSQPHLYAAVNVVVIQVSGNGPGPVLFQLRFLCQRVVQRRTGPDDLAGVLLHVLHVDAALDGREVDRVAAVLQATWSETIWGMGIFLQAVAVGYRGGAGNTERDNRGSENTFSSGNGRRIYLEPLGIKK